MDSTDKKHSTFRRLSAVCDTLSINGHILGQEPSLNKCNNTEFYLIIYINNNLLCSIWSQHNKTRI